MPECRVLLCYNFAAMKYLTLAVLLAVVQAAPPVPRKAADPSNKTSQNDVKQTGSNKAPSQPTTPSAVPIHAQPQQNDSYNPTSENAARVISVSNLPTLSVTKDWLDKLYVAFSGILIVIGFFGVRAAYKTLKAIERQVAEMKAQRETMQEQLAAMRGQLAQMEASGQQTDQLIEQAKAQVTHLKDSTDIALTNAENAVLHTKVLINAERPWVLIEESVSFPPGVGAVRRGHIYFRAKNWGKNPARVTRHCCEWIFWAYGTALPEEPEYHQTELLYANYLVPNDGIAIFDYDCASVMTDEFWDDMNKKNQRLLFTGHVVYVDLATDEEHETRFCYSYTPHGTLIMQGPRAYNRHT